MAKLSHKQKVKIASVGRTRTEERIGVSIFLSKAWLDRKDAIRKRVAKREAIQKKKAEERRKKLISQ